MLSSHEMCPVCKGELRHIKYINKACKIAGGKAMSFVESVCNNVGDLKSTSDIPIHQFFQVTSLYSERLFEKVEFPDQGRAVEVNYVLHESIMWYYPKPEFNIQDPNTKAWTPPEKIAFKRLLTLDYPKLEKTINKFNVLVPFL